MAEYARAKGIRGFTADILAENKAMLNLAGKCGQVEIETGRRGIRGRNIVRLIDCHCRAFGLGFPKLLVAVGSAMTVA
jgi:hypothetical protein